MRAPGARRRRVALLLLAVLVPLLIVRGCILDVDVIQGSSMEPAFYGGPLFFAAENHAGNDGSEDGRSLAGGARDADHLLVLRRGVDSRLVQRWDVVVLEGSVDPELPRDVGAMLKRVVGMLGESLFVQDGDVFVANDGARRILRKPDELVSALLVPMHSAVGLQPPWRW